MANEKTQGITIKKTEDFSEWYQQVVLKAELADYSPVKGCMIIKPNAYSIWQSIQDYFNERLKKLKVRNAYFPLFIPESFFKKESEHAEGFTPEVAWIEKEEGEERLAVRPTSETIIYDSYSKWVRSWRDLPLRINQWANVVRWETKATRLFLRTREFLWQEGHCVYETKKECDKETLKFLDEYENICKELLAIPLIKGKKTEKEKFAGALYTTTIESLMPDGKSLQCGTSHNLGQGFAKSFGIKFLSKDEKEEVPWQNSWGISTRLIGAMVMIHGDDKGLVLPPNVAYNKLVVVPIIFEKEKDEVLVESERIFKMLKIFNPIFDDRDGYSAGWKFNEWELKGIPIRIEVGPRDVKEKQVVLVRRDNNIKETVKVDKLKKRVKELLLQIQDDMYNKAKKFLDESIKEASNWKELENVINDKKIAAAFYCGNVNCEDSVKDKLNGVKAICIPFSKEKKRGSCVYCGKDSKEVAYFAKSY
ncbi:MAG TPA: proline--tRNA ligase [Candidatus Nanoarchaeia archaeon]|nr:proline--tRNA ligase [Candidatus Nanoarchaeia archaeon]